MERGYGTLDGYARCGLLCDAIETAAIVGTVSLAGQLKNTSRERRSVKPACTVSLQRRKEDSVYAYMYFSELSLSRRMYTRTMCIIYRSKNIHAFARFSRNIISLRMCFIALHTRATRSYPLCVLRLFIQGTFKSERRAVWKFCF